jgi:nucleoid DNA-binding protein
MTKALNKEVLSQAYYFSSSGIAAKEKIKFNKEIAKLHVDALISVITSYQISGAKIRFPKMGNLTARLKIGREGRNPQTNEDAYITARVVSTFVEKTPKKEGLINNIKVMPTLLKSTLAKKISSIELSETLVDLFFSEIQNVKDGIYEKAEFRGFGSFKGVVRRARDARNPKTGDSKPIESRIILRYKMSKEVKANIQHLLVSNQNLVTTNA